MAKARQRIGATFRRLRIDAFRKWRFLTSTFERPLNFPASKSPEVSIIVSSGLLKKELYRCLFEIMAHQSKSPSTEIFVIERNASPGVSALLQRCSGVRVVYSPATEHVSVALNRTVKMAKGRYLYFLDQALLTAGAIDALLRLCVANVGAAGSQVRSRDGRIIIPESLDASGYTDSRDPSVAYVRDWEFGSIPSVLVRLDAFTEAGGFNACDTWSACVYELTQTLRAKGFRVLYQPRSVVFEQSPCIAIANASVESREARGTILVVDDYVPFFDRSTGGKRMFGILKLMRSLGYHVILLPDEGGAHEPYTTILQQLGIDVRYRWKARDAVQEIQSIRKKVDIAWLSRPHLCAKYLPIMRAQTQAFTIYDTVDLHHRRLSGQKGSKADRDALRMRDLELNLARECDRTIVTTIEEQRILAAHKITTTALVPVIESMQGRSPARLEGRMGLLFVGNYTHEPNQDAARWLHEMILPLVRVRIPTITLTLAGAEPTPAVRALASGRVNVPGYIKDLQPLFDGHRVFVAPLRQGAGIKGKVVEALANGIPVVTTSIGAEGIPLRHELNAMIADDAAEFAASIVRLHEDDGLWRNLSANAGQVAEEFSPDAIRPLLERALRF